jgi:hypothetical protein
VNAGVTRGSRYCRARCIALVPGFSHSLGPLLKSLKLVPIRSGIGLRLGANVGYLKFTPRATWNPF